MDDSQHTPEHDHSQQYLAALSLRRTLTAAHSLTQHTPHPHHPERTDPRPQGLPLPLVTLGLAVSLAATASTLWALTPWLPWWALILTAPLAAAPALITGTIALLPLIVSTTRRRQGHPTGRDWITPTTLTLLACAFPLLSPLPTWANALILWTLLLTATLLSTYRALPALGRDIDLDHARATWDTHPD
ncbi:hypothetical protein ABZ635_21430 [Nocardiopsis sp. NPDC007018]|uniref:hypothetical protein n=1 Tax=Nocardiopsis sp. NPDC007018 TaxID=3155721 RepID=UPI0033D29BBF